MVDRRHLKPDDPAPEHQHALGDEIDLERPGRIPDARIGGNKSGRGGFGAGGDDRLVEAHDPSALRRFYTQGVSRGELALSDHGLDLALLREADEAAGQALDHAVLPAANGRWVEGRRAEAHAVRTHRLGVVDHLGDMQQRLGRDAADVEAYAAECRARVDQDDVLPQIGSTEGGGVAAGTRPQNQDIGLEISLAPRVRRRLRRWTCGCGGLGRGFLDFGAAASGRRRPARLWASVLQPPASPLRRLNRSPARRPQ